MKVYLSVKQAVKRLNRSVSAKLIYVLIARGKLRVNRNLGRILIEEDSLIELMAGPPEVPSEPPPPVRARGRPKKDKMPLW